MPTEPRVYNVKNGDAPPDAVYIGRRTTRGGHDLPRSKWANPYRPDRVGGRERAIELYREYLHSSGLIGDIGELTGRDLLCWCAPAPCDGDVLLELANGAVDDGD